MKFVLEQQGPVVPAAVYLFQRRDRRRFKVGSSVDPVARAAQLPEFKAGLLDLPKSLALWLPTPMRAHQVERSLHRGLAPYRVPADHQGDGHTEWFAPAALLPAMRLLGQMPSGERGGGTLPIRPEEAPAVPSRQAATHRARNAARTPQLRAPGCAECQCGPGPVLRRQAPRRL